jgi:hypothetical protein
MKKVLLFFAFVLSFAFTQAQSEADMVKQIYRQEKEALVFEAMTMTESEKAIFAPIYKAYEGERQALASRRIDLLKNYAKNYSTLTNDNAASILKEWASINKSEAKLIDKYTKKVQKGMDATNALQFKMIELAISNTIRGNLLQELPLPK